MMSDTKTPPHEKVKRGAFEQCPNCSEYKLATVMRFTYSHWVWALIDLHHLHIKGEWSEHRKVCCSCEYIEEI